MSEERKPERTSSQPTSGPARWRPLPQHPRSPGLTPDQEALVEEYITQYGRFTNERYRDLHSQ
jgi:hypothetical protein